MPTTPNPHVNNNVHFQYNTNNTNKIYQNSSGNQVYIQNTNGQVRPISTGSNLVINNNNRNNNITNIQTTQPNTYYSIV